MPLITLYESNAIRYEFDPEKKDSILGRGGMGVVFKGRRIHNDTQQFDYVAIKGLFSDLPEDSISRARREASIQIEHENLLRMYGFLEARDNKGRPTYHVISEYIDGVPLSDILKQRGRFSQNEAISIVKKSLSALNMLHEAGYIHRDIDPSNIMICNGTGRVKLIDFGIAKRMSEFHDEFKQGTIAGRLIGKINYASPEQARGEHWVTNKTSDIYSTGIMLYHLLCGRLPFEGEPHEIIKGHQSGVIQYDESISISLKYVIDKAAAKLQGDRYQSASEFIVDLEKIENGVVLIAKRSKSDNSSSLWLVVVGAIVSLLVMVGGAIFLINANHSNAVEQAEYQLSIGLYQSSLDHFRSANRFIKSDDVRVKIAMLEILTPAIEAYNSSDYNVAKRLFEEAATNYDSADAYYYLGEMSYEGIGVPKSYQQGLEYTMQASKLGSELANYRLGLAYKNGLGVDVDNNQAAKYFEEASKIVDNGVESKSPELLYIKGYMYLEGNHIQYNKDRAIRYFTAAAELGYPQAQYELYNTIYDDDTNLAIEWLEKAVDSGYPKAECEMCFISYDNRDYKRALEMIQRAASKNYSPALQTLGAWYSTTQNYAQILGFQSDDTKSHNYTRQALEYDFENIGAMYDMWSDFSKGKGVAADPVQAMKYKRMALNKLDDMPYSLYDDRRVYHSDSAQVVWDKLSN